MTTLHTDDECLAALKQCGSIEGAARALGVNRRTLQRRKERWVKRGWAPEFDMRHPVAEGFAVKGTSTLYREDGSVAAQWVKSREDLQRQKELMDAAIAGMCDAVTRVPRVAAPRRVASDLLNLFIVTDYHIGMLAWGEETRGDNWDTSIAERLLSAWFREAIARAPAAETAVFAQLGDFLHFDGLEAVTPEHRNLLDADTRYAKVVRIAQRAVRDAITQLLAKHKRVHVIMAEGNHDPSGSVWLREATAALWENNPRVTVDTSPDPYYCVEHGLTSLFFHHGHKRRPQEIDDVFAAKFRDVFGRTKYSYAHMGHLHHAALKESPLMVVEQHRTLAAADAYASRGGWLSGRDAPVITYSKQYGQVGRVVLSPKAVLS
jgi:UDP-2,3-diacylglucosamine pyrophosphatase LpxH